MNHDSYFFDFYFVCFAKFRDSFATVKEREMILEYREIRRWNIKSFPLFYS